MTMAISRTPNKAVARRDEYERSQAERERRGGTNLWHTIFAMRYSTAQAKGIPDDELVDVEIECQSTHGRGIMIGEFLIDDVGFCPDKLCRNANKGLFYLPTP